ncbi:hypothetical protein LWF15_30850 [Kineosporia rhizophila]|uniref:hypothetical protein n=1 Tax=Kineosporia TaxID=49184 RepID=UPI000B1ADBB8|nr:MULTISPECIES: hypothetical protein [Kineosporia]MCE0539904.1 hypothetical protein [Kineosporia rhizophila]GLY17382.1 hypothetical protein Kisp01_43970 [Kineosporia sp. NBRC 101677]
MRPPRALALATFATAVLLTACSGGDAEKTPDAGGDGGTKSTGQVSEASKGEACEQYRDLSAQVEAASNEAASVTVSNEEDGQKVTELMTKVSELTEKADAAYALCYAEGAEPQATSS